MKTQRCGSIPRRVVVTGLGAVAPNGVGAQAFGAALRAGVTGIDTIASFDPERLDCRIAAEIKQFSPADFVGEKDMRRLGRVVPLLLAATGEALHQARVCTSSMSIANQQSWGVVIGSGGGAPDFMEEQYRRYFADQISRVSAYNISSSTPGSLSSEVSLRFGFRGPSHLISTGCTSSTDALGYAFNMIRFALADHLVSGGGDAAITPGVMRGFCVMGAVCASRNHDPARASRPFDRTRDGFVLGEGAWILVLEERERALARGATIYGEILGYAATCDAHHRVRLDPNGVEPARAMTLAIEDAKLDKSEIGYVALHGTSTRLNDKTETLAAKRCFGARAYDVPMSSIKSMIGHPQGASGAANVMGAILAMNGGFLPPTVNYEEADPECDLDYIPNTSIERSIDVALCNCIGFGSKNSALVVARG